MVCSVSWSGRTEAGKETLLCFTCLHKYQHSNFLAPVIFSSRPAFFLFPSFSLTLCPQFWAKKDLFLWVELKEKKWSCNMPESSWKHIKLPALFSPLGFSPSPQCCLSAQSHPSAVYTKPVGCHCATPAVASGFLIFILLEQKISFCNLSV